MIQSSASGARTPWWPWGDGSTPCEAAPPPAAFPLSESPTCSERLTLGLPVRIRGREPAPRAWQCGVGRRNSCAWADWPETPLALPSRTGGKRGRGENLREQGLPQRAPRQPKPPPQNEGPPQKCLRKIEANGLVNSGHQEAESAHGEPSRHPILQETPAPRQDAFLKPPPGLQPRGPCRVPFSAASELPAPRPLSLRPRGP